jgi:hypothetical protein
VAAAPGLAFDEWSPTAGPKFPLLRSGLQSLGAEWSRGGNISFYCIFQSSITPLTKPVFCSSAEDNEVVGWSWPRNRYNGVQGEDNENKEDSEIN